MIKFICIEPMLWKGNTLSFMDEGVCTQDEFSMLSAAGNVVFKCNVEEPKIKTQMVNLEKRIEKRAGGKKIR